MWMLFFLHTPFFFKGFKKAKYSVSCRCHTSLKIGAKSALPNSAVCFGKQNNFGSVLKCKSIIVRHVTEFSISVDAVICET
jgi:hypothetical protein